MNHLTREEIIEIVGKLQRCEYASEVETDSAIATLRSGVLDPKITDYIFWDELTPEEIADRALSYRPILL